MGDQVSNLVRVENGPRFVMRGEYRGHRVTVVTGYLPTLDQWPFHVYVQIPGEAEQRLTPQPTTKLARTMEKAFAAGFRYAQQSLSMRTLLAGNVPS